jgi:hypothetical protein
MKRPAEKKKAVVPPKKTGQGKRTSVKKTGSSIPGAVKKGVKKKPVGGPTRPVKETKKAAKPSAKFAERIAKPARIKKTLREPPKTSEKASSASAKITSRVSARKNAPLKTAAKAAPKKPLRKPAGSVSPATKLPAKRTKSLKTKGKASRREVVSASKAGLRELPREYGQNEVILMSVDPHVIFVDWEIRKEQVPDEGIPVMMRVFDVTSGGGRSGLPRDRFFDLHLDGRVGSGFFEVRMPGREIAIEIGLYRGEHFSPILQSEKVSMPELVVPDELGIARKLFESGVPVGY